MSKQKEYRVERSKYKRIQGIEELIIENTG